VRPVHRLGAALLLVALGRVLSPAAVPVYDGLGAPDEPYRYVAPPAGAARTAAPTAGVASSPVVAGVSSYGMSVTSAEQGPQVSVFVPPKALAATGRTVRATATPLAPTDQPPGARIDGNVYDVAFLAAGPVTLTPQAALAEISLRATTARQPGPVFEHRAAAGRPWVQLQTTRAGTDVYAASFRAPGQYALAFLATAKSRHASSSAPLLVGGGLLLLIVVVVVVRLRAAG
jgi:hypothetical protein